MRYRSLRSLVAVQRVVSARAPCRVVINARVGAATRARGPQAAIGRGPPFGSRAQSTRRNQSVQRQRGSQLLGLDHHYLNHIQDYTSRQTLTYMLSLHLKCIFQK